MTRNGWDEIDWYVVISTDRTRCRSATTSRTSREWHDQFDAWAASYVSPYDDLIHATAVRNWDSEMRISEMDADGVSGEIILPNTVPPFFPTSALIILGLPTTEEELAPRWAGVQAHNRWVVDFVAQAPQRRRGIVQTSRTTSTLPSPSCDGRATLVSSAPPCSPRSLPAIRCRRSSTLATSRCGPPATSSTCRSCSTMWQRRSCRWTSRHRRR